MKYALLLPLILLGLAGCVVDRTTPSAPSTTYVTPAPTTTYVAPANSPPGSSTTTTVRTPY